MVVCKFFQQGSCRFGKSCRFEHVYSSKYSYNANQQPQAPPTTVTDEQLIAQVIADTQGIIRGGQWVLSSYAPFKDKPNLPGLNDLSFEEARLFIYEAKANNTLDNAISFFNHLVKEARTKYEQLTQATPNTIKLLRTLYMNVDDSTPPGSQQTFGSSSSNPAASLFRSAAQSGSVFGQSNQSNVANTNLFGGQPSQSTVTNTSSIFGGQPNQPFGGQTNQTSSVFGQQSSVFGQQSLAPAPAQSIFAQANQSIFGQANQQLNQAQQPSASSIFAGAAQNAFGSSSIFNQSQTVQAPSASSSPFPNVFQQKTETPNVFGQNNQPSSNVFGQTSQPSSNVFGQASQPSSNVFGQTSQPSSNVFGQTSQPASNVFGQANNANSFGQSASIFGQTNNDEALGIYSKLEDLSEDDIEMYKSDDFKLGFIPELPPPKSLCF